MRKKLNSNNKKIMKNIITVIILIVFLLFTCTSLALINRNYFFAEKVFKNMSSMVNSYVISNVYSTCDVSKNLSSSRINYLEKENNELRKSLSLSEKKSEYEAAEIINHTMKNWFNKLEVSKGYDSGIKKDDAVISKDGLVGFVSKVAKKASEVRLITGVNDNNMLSVIIETNLGNVSGVLKKYDSKTGLFKVTDVMSKNQVLEGNKVVLSGYDNASYKGIYVGKVVKQEVSNYGLSKTIWVEPGVNFNDLLFVTIIKETKWLQRLYFLLFPFY